jgi:hypothetical protein
MAKPDRTPLKDDRVTILTSNELVYRVTAVYTNPCVVDLQSIAAPHYKKTGVPWDSLIYLEKPREDFSQAAARIVREATEKV